MTVAAALAWAGKRLSLRSSSARLDAEVLLAHLLEMERASLLARPELMLDPEIEAAYHQLVARREEGEPIAYLTGHKEFFGLDLLVDKSVLVPRPETESVVEACLDALARGGGKTFADIGTGSGAILVAVAERMPGLKAYGTDISPDAVRVAALNCQRHGVADRVELFVGNLLEPLPEPVYVIAANLPYVSPGEAEPDVATWEPQVAVFGGGPDGTSTIREFLANAPHYLLAGGTIVMETAYSQGRIVSKLAGDAFPTAKIEVRQDLAGYDRIVIVDTSMPPGEPTLRNPSR